MMSVIIGCSLIIDRVWMSPAVRAFSDASENHYY
jgi:hypothetical protein